ncbi:MAG: ABC transporter ATP-binding protein [Candidatus Rokubacteria bacterium]|nr:ABC transporter ATP-binding protein [Candidatus Rokubacteria bacterium]MBI3824482.1 ABC transporter ATP-binding protein [Candidatus Rokubacteria bacterium]
MTPLLELDGVGFRYPAPAGGRGGFALADVSLALAPGEVLAVIGPNSAGKTTLIRLLSRVLEPDAGEIRLDGRPLAEVPRAALARAVAVVAQDAPPALPFSVEQLVLMGRYPHAPTRFFESDDDRAAAREAMALTGVAELAPAPVGRLGGGERQRVMLARALAQRPRLLVLDEPTAHLDLRYQVECVALLRRVNRERGVAIVLVSHDLDLAAEVADRLLFLDRGRVARLGAAVDVLEERLLSEIYGCRVTVERNPESGRPSVRVVWPAAPAGAPAHRR